MGPAISAGAAVVMLAQGDSCERATGVIVPDYRWSYRSVVGIPSDFRCGGAFKPAGRTRSGGTLRVLECAAAVAPR